MRIALVLLCVAAFMAGCAAAADVSGDGGTGANDAGGGGTGATPSCKATPSPATLDDSVTIQIETGLAQQTVLVRIVTAGATVDKEVLTSGTGSASLIILATEAGSAVVEVHAAEDTQSAIVATCLFKVADSSGCGDDQCKATESCEECAADCGECTASCGDGICGADETCSTCADDCGSCDAVCGDGTCNLVESCQSCPGDCDVCSASCGDGQCNNGETCGTCSKDCGPCAAKCGDGTCNGTETCATCPADCKACAATCGDHTCQSSETCTSCPGDCGTCAPTCGDGQCNGTETCTTCAKDCGACVPKCGDLLCNGTETCTSCPGDCGACTACEPASTALPSGRHKAGTACLTCHNGAVVKFSVAGTVYKTAAGTSAQSGATIVLTDASGKTVKLISASNGNFYSKDTSLKAPFKARASRCPGNHPMNGSANSANCNSCHKSGNRIYTE